MFRIAVRRRSDEQHAQARGRDGEEVDRDQVPHVVGEERAPGLRRRCAPLRQQPRDRALCDDDPELREFPVDSRRAHSGLAFAIRVTRAMIRGPVGDRPTGRGAESFVQCSENRRRCHRRTVSGGHDHERVPRLAPELREDDPEQAIGTSEPGPLHCPLVHRELLAQGDVSSASCRWPPQRKGRSRSMGRSAMIIGR